MSKSKEADRIVKDLFAINFKKMTEACYYAKEGQYQFWLAQYPEATPDYNGNKAHPVFWKVQTEKNCGETTITIQTAWENYSILTLEAAKEKASKFYEDLYSIELKG